MDEDDDGEKKVLIWRRRRVAANINHHLMLLVPNVNYFRSILYCNALHSMLLGLYSVDFQFIAVLYNDTQCTVIWSDIHVVLWLPGGYKLDEARKKVCQIRSDSGAAVSSAM